MNVQAAVLYPMLLLTVMTILQAGLYLYGRDMARSAARAGLDEGRSFGTMDTTAAEARTRDVLLRRGGNILTDTAVTAREDATTMTVNVDAAVVTLVPGFNLRVTQSATGALERITR